MSDTTDYAAQDTYGFRAFVSAYLDAINFTDCGPDDDPELQEGCWSPELLFRAKADCREFYNAHQHLFELHPDGLTRAAHDFWFTRNGHGAGFWDGDWPEPAATILDKAAEAFGPVEIEAGDDGLIYFFG